MLSNFVTEKMRKVLEDQNNEVEIRNSDVSNKTTHI